MICGKPGRREGAVPAGGNGVTQAVRWEENGVFRNQVKARTFAPHRGAEQSDFLKADTEALRIFQMTKDKEKTLRAAGEHGSWVTGRRAGQGVAGRGRPRPQPPPSPEDTRHRDFCSKTTRNDSSTAQAGRRRFRTRNASGLSCVPSL